MQQPLLTYSWEVRGKPQGESHNREACHFSFSWHKVPILGYVKVTLYGCRGDTSLGNVLAL